MNRRKLQNTSLWQYYFLVARPLKTRKYGLYKLKWWRWWYAWSGLRRVITDETKRVMSNYVVQFIKRRLKGYPGLKYTKETQYSPIENYDGCFQCQQESWELRAALVRLLEQTVTWIFMNHISITCTNRWNASTPGMTWIPRGHLGFSRMTSVSRDLGLQSTENKRTIKIITNLEI